MPTIPELKVPPPSSWEEFEQIAVSALKIRWNVTEITRYGRPRQPQDGVDFYGFTHAQKLHGVQCKNTEELPLRVVQEEVAKAEGFQPSLDAYFIATTAPRDVKLQQAVLFMTKERLAQKKFPVTVIYWEDLLQDLARDKSEFFKHFPELKPAGEEQRFNGLTYDEMADSLRGATLECKEFLGAGGRSDLLTQFVALERYFQEGHISDAAGAVPAWLHFTYHHMVRPLFRHGLVEEHRPPMSALAPCYRLSAVGRTFLLRHHQVSAVSPTASEGA
jgi:hypothetical protein